jgi:hypothetical protein
MLRKALTRDYRHLLTGIVSRVKQDSTDKTSLKYIGRIVDFFAGMNWSIRTKILLSFCVVILMMGATNAVLILWVLEYNRQYDPTPVDGRKYRLR